MCDRVLSGEIVSPAFSSSSISLEVPGTLMRACQRARGWSILVPPWKRRLGGVGGGPQLVRGTSASLALESRASRKCGSERFPSDGRRWPFTRRWLEASAVAKTSSGRAYIFCVELRLAVAVCGFSSRYDGALIVGTILGGPAYPECTTGLRSGSSGDGS